MAGRPKRADLFGGQGVERETVTYWLDKRIVAAIREVAKSRVPRRGAAKLTASSVAEGAFFWGLYCLHHHSDDPDSCTVSTWQEAKADGLELDRFERIGTVDEAGRYHPDEPSDYKPRKQPKRRRKP